MPPFSLTSSIKTYPELPYEDMKNAVLGKRYELTLMLVGPDRAASINRLTRQKTYAPNVLSFPYSATCGEIVICPAVAKREAPDFNLSYPGYVGFLFIHGLLHLKGFDHGEVMEKHEQTFLRRFRLS